MQRFWHGWEKGEAVLDWSDFGFWILDFGLERFWILDFGLELQWMDSLFQLKN